MGYIYITLLNTGHFKSEARRNGGVVVGPQVNSVEISGFAGTEGRVAVLGVEGRVLEHSRRLHGWRDDRAGVVSRRGEGDLLVACGGDVDRCRGVERLVGRGGVSKVLG